MNTEILTKKELAALVKVSERTVERQLQAAKEGDVIIFQIYRAFRIGKQWRFQSVKEKLTNEAA